MPSGQEHPGGQRPGPHPARPGGVDAALDQRRDGEGEGDREADIAEVEERRMDGEADVLQDRIEVAALRAAPGSSRANGLEVKRMKRRKAAPIQPCTASTRRAQRGRAGCAPKTATSAPKSARISTQRSIEPSWLPQTPVTLKSSGFAEWEFSKTLLHARSRRSRRPRSSAAKASAMSSEAEPSAAVGATAISRSSRAAQPDERHARLDEHQRRAPAPARNGRARRSESAPISRSARPLAFLPDALRLQRVDDLLRHVVLVVLGEHGVGGERRRRRQARLRRRRPAPRGRGPEGCRDKSTASVFAVR